MLSESKILNMRTLDYITENRDAARIKNREYANTTLGRIEASRIQDLEDLIVTFYHETFSTTCQCIAIRASLVHLQEYSGV